jgi:hypothetical protein
LFNFIKIILLKNISAFFNNKKNKTMVYMSELSITIYKKGYKFLGLLFIVLILPLKKSIKKKSNHNLTIYKRIQIFVGFRFVYSKKKKFFIITSHNKKEG